MDSRAWCQHTCYYRYYWKHLIAQKKNRREFSPCVRLSDNLNFVPKLWATNGRPYYVVTLKTLHYVADFSFYCSISVYCKFCTNQRDNHRKREKKKLAQKSGILPLPLVFPLELSFRHLPPFPDFFLLCDLTFSSGHMSINHRP